MNAKQSVNIERRFLSSVCEKLRPQISHKVSNRIQTRVCNPIRKAIHKSAGQQLAEAFAEGLGISGREAARIVTCFTGGSDSEPIDEIPEQTRGRPRKAAKAKTRKTTKRSTTKPLKLKQITAATGHGGAAMVFGLDTAGMVWSKRGDMGWACEGSPKDYWKE